MPIVVENISYTYNRGELWEKQALDNISFTLGKGEILGLYGETGSGKSTLLQLLNALLPVQHGTILVNEQDIRNLSGKTRRNVGLVNQYPEKQLFARTVYEDIAFGPASMGIKGSELAKRVQNAMELLGLEYKKFKKRAPFSLSEGEKRKTAIAGILAMEPEYLLLDEPTAGLDKDGREQLFSVLKLLRQQGNTGIILVSHQPADILLLSDRLLMLRNGKLSGYGETLEVIKEFETSDMLKRGITISREIMYRLIEKGWSLNMQARNPFDAAREIIKGIKGENRHVSEK